MIIIKHIVIIRFISTPPLGHKFANHSPVYFEIMRQPWPPLSKNVLGTSSPEFNPEAPFFSKAINIAIGMKAQ